ncbi:MAG: DUF4286 family protein [Niabella sp.]
MSNEATIIYNVTNKVSHSIHNEWLIWMKAHHIPAVLNTGCFFKASVLRLKDIDDNEGPTYAVQYHAKSQADYERYLADFSAALRQEAMDKWGDQFIAFRTVMEVVD